MERKKDLKNWWYYYKWYVIIGCILIAILINLIGNYFHLWSPTPDYQIAYIGSPLPYNTEKALEDAFSSVSTDLNGDGRVVIQINQYLSHEAAEASGATEALLASEVSLTADIEDQESYFFLTEDPEQLQNDYHILASAEGSAPDDFDNTVDDKVLSWGDTIFSSYSLGAYTYTSLGQVINGNSDEWMQTFYIGRRYYYDKMTAENADDLDAIWNTITEN